MLEAALNARFHKAIELIGRRWSGAIIHMLFWRPARFAELRASIPDITDRMLSERLQELEAAGLVVRRVLPAIPVRVEYLLSAKGRALEPAMCAVGEWANDWLTDVPRPSAAQRVIASERAERAERASRTEGPRRAPRRAAASPKTRRSRA